MQIRNDPKTRETIAMGLICMIWMDTDDALYEGLEEIYGNEGLGTWIQENVKELSKISDKTLGFIEMLVCVLLSKNTEK